MVRPADRCSRLADDPAIAAAVEQKRSEGAARRDLISFVIRAEVEGGRLDDADIAMFIRMIIGFSTSAAKRA